MGNIIKLSYKDMYESELKKIYQSASIQDLELALTTIKSDIDSEVQYLNVCTDELYKEEIKRNIVELKHEAMYVRTLIDLYNETQLNSLEQQSNEQ